MIINYSDFEKIRKEHADKKIVYATGTFDLTHPGHVLFFEDCKKLGDILVVGIGKDILLKQQKDPSRPVLNQTLRLKMVDSLKAVDYCFIIQQEVWKGENTHKEMMVPVFKSLKPDFFIINRDGPNIDERKKLCAENGVKIAVLNRECPEEYEGVSTSKLIEKIKRLP